MCVWCLRLAVQYSFSHHTAAMVTRGNETPQKQTVTFEHAHCGPPGCFSLSHINTDSNTHTGTFTSGTPLQDYKDGHAHTSTSIQQIYSHYGVSTNHLLSHTHTRYKYPCATQSESVVYPQAAVPHSHSTELCVSGERKCVCVWRSVILSLMFERQREG